MCARTVLLFGRENVFSVEQPIPETSEEVVDEEGEGRQSQPSPQKSTTWLPWWWCNAGGRAPCAEQGAVRPLFYSRCAPPASQASLCRVPSGRSGYRHVVQHMRHDVIRRPLLGLRLVAHDHAVP